MKCFYGALILVTFLFITVKLLVADEIHYDRVELKNNSYNPDYYNFSVYRIFKFNRTAYAMNLKVDIFVDVNDDAEAEVAFFYNRFNNNQYSRIIIRVPRSKYCESYKRFQSLIVAEDMKSKTTFPDINDATYDDKTCIKKVN